MLLHDTASNQLVETAIISTDFSQSVFLQRALQQSQLAQTQAERPPSRERRHSPPRTSSSRNRSRDRRRDYSRRSPSPDYYRRSSAPRRWSPTRYSRDQSPPPRCHYSLPGDRNRETPREPRSNYRAERSQQNEPRLGNQYRDPERDFAYAPTFLGEGSNQGWGVSASTPPPRSPAKDNTSSANPSTARGK